MKRIVLGMTAHVDSGKTTLAEAMLYCSGGLRRLGRVDHGDAFLDTDPLERSRGITIFSKQALLRTENCEFTLLDTPGHVDFAAETERALSVLDCAVLVISGTDGVQSHTETIWRMLRRFNIPVFIFVNKMDISITGREALLGELKKKFGAGCIDFSDTEAVAELSAECDEECMEAFLADGSVSDGLISAAILSRSIFPVCFGSALKLRGVEDFLAILDRFAPEPQRSEEFAARVFKISEEGGTRLTHIKINGGTLRVRSVIDNSAPSEKVNQIRIYSGAKFSTADEIPAGTVCAVSGLTKTYAGEGLGTAGNSGTPLMEPVLSYKMLLPDGTDIPSTLAKLRKIEEEDPQLRITWSEQLHEIHISLMGEIQLEVLRSIISERFGINVGFDEGSIAYKETIAAPVVGMGHYEPLRHYAEVHLLLEPAERGSGMHFAADCRMDDLDINWQRLILTHLEEKQHIGVLTGSPITDMKITVVAGRAHIKHTEGGDFRQATYRAVRQGLAGARSVLLEPYYDFTLEIPAENVGRAMTDLQRMGAEFDRPEHSADSAVISGSCPVSEMRGYHREVIGYTRGKGRLSCIPKGYLPCHNAEEVIGRIRYDFEADSDNSPDSVFCSHGAGHVVKWYDAPKYMHTDSGLRFGEEQKEAPENREQKINASREQRASDEELMAIFERTYGRINRDEHTAMRREKQPRTEKIPKLPVPPKGPEYLLVDGYNIIFAWEELSALAKESLDLARNRLIHILCNYQGFRSGNVILVFDAYKVKGNHREVEKVNNISVVYTREAETADMYIEKTAHELTKNNRVRVATSDNTEQIIVMGSGAIRVSASEFLSEVREVEKTIRGMIEQ